MKSTITLLKDRIWQKEMSPLHTGKTLVYRFFKWRKLVLVLEQKYIMYHHLSPCSFLLVQKRTKKNANDQNSLVWIIIRALK
ncbi:hypothetical protein [Rhodohalobacter sp. SW132]|uniref:hypothetical protein n=1 Tax=Rhodohalobacter sp. SW132 TaxID=2293433 RepID=UPI000E273F3B|nr:hypothetical protein [Rhodohalobacter sp. SW132]